MRFYFESYGCTMNHGEARIMQDIIRKKGHSIVHNIQDSDAQVLVTCTVIKTTELRMMKRLITLSKTKKPVIVAGCMASVQKDQILALNPKAIILIPQTLRNIGNIADTLQKEGRKMDKDPRSGPITEVSTDAIIPISSGCLGSCTYCITKLARGKLRSYPPEKIIEGIRSALADGYKAVSYTHLTLPTTPYV